jgi:hypothetical protein
MIVKKYKQGTASYNSGLVKMVIQCSAVSFMVNQTLEICINICDKNRHLSFAAKLYGNLITTLQTLTDIAKIRRQRQQI